MKSIIKNVVFKGFLPLLLLISLISPVFVTGADIDISTLSSIKPPSTISISEKGEVSVKNAVVYMVSGPTLFVRTYWDDAFIRWTIRVSGKTELIKKFNGAIKVSDIKVGHILNAEGTMISGADSLNINATVVRDLNLEDENGKFSGVVTRANDGTSTFVIKTDSGKSVTIKVDGSVTIKKGARYITLSEVVYGDKIVTVEGIYHQPTESVKSNFIEVYQTKKIFEPRNFQGKLKSLSSTSLPTVAVVSIDNIDYTFNLPSNAEVLTNKRKPVSLQRYVIGDTVRLYGKIRETNLTMVDAEIIRNLDL